MHPEVVTQSLERAYRNQGYYIDPQEPVEAKVFVCCCTRIGGIASLGMPVFRNAFSETLAIISRTFCHLQ
jgi:hypothetical protein